MPLTLSGRSTAGWSAGYVRQPWSLPVQPPREVPIACAKATPCEPAAQRCGLMWGIDGHRTPDTAVPSQASKMPTRCLAGSSD